jgi:hypothetical protein
MIPGLKVLDDIIAGLPTNSAQRLELAKLRGEIETRDRIVSELRAKLEVFERNDAIDAETVRVLKLFFDERREISSEEISLIFDMKSSVADFHIDDLGRRGLIVQNRDTKFHLPAFVITADGRAFIFKHRMA